MTVESSHNSTNIRYPFNNNQNAPFQKLFDATQSYLMNANNNNNNDLKNRLNLTSSQFMLYPPWKNSSNNNNSSTTGTFPKYFPPPVEALTNYLQHHHHHHPFLHNHHGPSPDMIKYIDKIREDELAIKIKDKPDAKLCEEELWKKFNSLTTEMVITKSGRRMFPAFKVQLTGLDPKSKYVLALEVAPCDDNRFKFHNGKWTLAGKADPESNRLMHFHCESPSSGEAWMQKPVWFNKVKLTNNPTDKDPQHLVLNSMHKYIMRLYIFRCDDSTKYRFCIYPEVFTFKTTEFIAVTAYQNDKITQLKIDNNPFAKGFRDNGSGRREKKRLKLQQTISSTSPDSPPIGVTVGSGACDESDAEELCSPHDKSTDTLNPTNDEVILKLSGASSNLKRKLSSSADQTELEYLIKRRNGPPCLFPSFPHKSSRSPPALLDWDSSSLHNKSMLYPPPLSSHLRSPHTVHYTPSSSSTSSAATLNSANTSSAFNLLNNPHLWLSTAAVALHQQLSNKPPQPPPLPTSLVPPQQSSHFQMLSYIHNLFSNMVNSGLPQTTIPTSNIGTGNELCQDSINKPLLNLPSPLEPSSPVASSHSPNSSTANSKHNHNTSNKSIFNINSLI